MSYEITTLGAELAAGFDTIIDVRAPAEFAEDHIPGAINLPAFTDAERAQVGTIYVQDSAFKARKVGAAILARNVAAHLEGPLAGKDGAWQPLVYCSRGGQRSGGVTSILSQIGWRAERVTGGYKSYRRKVVDLLYTSSLPHRFVLLDGNTGSGKTAVLHKLAARGVQVIDLEALAAHKGSLLGATDAGQPAQKMFESRLALALSALDPARPLVIEAESSKVGERLVPASLWKAMLAAPRIDIDVPLAARAEFLVRDYAGILAQPGAMATRLETLRPFCGHAQICAWQDMLREGAYESLSASLMERHYDPGYRRSRRAKEHHVLGRANAGRLDAAGIETLADQVCVLLDQFEPHGAIGDLPDPRGGDTL